MNIAQSNLPESHSEESCSAVEVITDGEQVLAYVVRGDWTPSRTQFLTSNDLGQQMGMIVYSAGDRIVPHLHLPVVREVHGTTECIVVRKGSCELDIYSSGKQLITSRYLKTGDIALLIAGGHGFRMTEDTTLFEVKQGPYVGTQDKERF